MLPHGRPFAGQLPTTPAPRVCGQAARAPEFAAQPLAQQNLHVSELLAQADEIQLDSPAVRAARAMQLALQEATKLIEALAAAAAAGNASALKDLIERSRAATVQLPEVATAVQGAEQRVSQIEVEAAARVQAEAAARAEAETQAQAQAQADARAAAEVEAQRANFVASTPSPQLQPLNATSATPSTTPRAPSSGTEEDVSAQSPLRLTSFMTACLVRCSQAWVASAEGDRSLPCVPLASRVARLVQGFQLVKVAPAKDRRFSFSVRNRPSSHHLFLSNAAFRSHACWERKLAVSG